MFEKYCFRSFLTPLANIPPCQDSKWKYDIARSWSKEYTVHPRPTLLKQSDHLEIELLWHFLSEQGLYLGACKVNAVFNISLSGPNFIWLFPPSPFIANRGTRKRVLLDHQVDFNFDFLISPRNPFNSRFPFKITGPQFYAIFSL